MNALTVVAAPAAVSNHAHYDAAMNAAKLVGQNFGTLAKNMRTLAIELVRASKVEGFALQEAITDAKSKMKWTRLDSKDQNRINQVFRDVRTIDGAWGALTPELQEQFLTGGKTPSTLAAEIRKAEADQLKAEAEADANAERAEAERAIPVAENGAPAQAPAPAPAPAETMVSIVDQVTVWVQALRAGGLAEAAPSELLALHHLIEEIDGFRADMAKPARLAGE